MALLDDLESWRRRLTSELGAFPDTLAALREGVMSFEKVTRRLLEVTEAMEQLVGMYAGLYSGGVDQARRRLDEVNRLVSQAPGGERFARAVEELTEAFGRMNPIGAVLGTAAGGSSAGRTIKSRGGQSRGGQSRSGQSRSGQSRSGQSGQGGGAGGTGG